MGLTLFPVFQKTWPGQVGVAEGSSSPPGDRGGEEAQGRDCGELAFPGAGGRSQGRQSVLKWAQNPCGAEGFMRTAWRPLLPHPRLDQRLLSSPGAQAPRFGWQRGGGRGSWEHDGTRRVKG